MSNPPNSPDSNETPPSTSPYPRPPRIPASHILSSHPHIPTSSDLLRIPPLNSPPFHTPLQPRPSASPHIESKIQQILQSFPDSWLLPPESGETFPSKQDAIQRMQAYGFSAGVAFYPEYKRFGRGDKMRFRCVHFHPKWEPRRIVQRFQTDMFAKRKLVIRVVRSFSENLGVRSIGLGCRYRVDLRGKSRDGDIGGEKDVWVLDVAFDEHNHLPLSVPFWYLKHDAIYPGAQAIRGEMLQYIADMRSTGGNRQNSSDLENLV